MVDGKQSKEVFGQIVEAKAALTLQAGERSAIIVSGEALEKILQHSHVKDEFIQTADKATVVLACRVSPK